MRSHGQEVLMNLPAIPLLYYYKIKRMVLFSGVITVFINIIVLLYQSNLLRQEPQKARLHQISKQRELFTSHRQQGGLLRVVRGP